MSSTVQVEATKALQELKVSELRSELEKRGIDKSGIKAALIDKLEQALKAEGHDVQSYRFTVREVQPVQSPLKKAEVLEENQNIQNGEHVEEDLSGEHAEKPSGEAGGVESEKSPAPNPIREAQVDIQQNTTEQPEGITSSALNAETTKNIAKENEVTVGEEADQMIKPSETDQQMNDDDDEPDIIIEPPKKTVKHECIEITDLTDESATTTNEKSSLNQQKTAEQTQPTQESENATNSSEKQQSETGSTKLATSTSADDSQTAKSVENVVMIEQQQPPKEAVVAVKQQHKQQRQTLVGGSNLSASLWIRNITTSTKAADLKALFSKHGKVVTAKIFTTKNKQSPTCFGYVTLADAEAADTCAQKLNRSNFKGRIINVEKADRSNLSQFDKGSQQQKDVVAITPTKNSDTSHEKTKSGKNADTSAAGASSSTSTKKSTRPRITAVKDATGGSSSSRKRVDKRSASKHDYVSRGPYRDMRSRIVPTAYDRHGTALYAAREARSTPIYRRVVHNTSRGIRISTSMMPPFGPREAARSDIQRDFSHHRMLPQDEFHRFSSNDTEREEMVRLMRRREEEHRKKEEELRLEKEREKLKYERERLERERLELEHMKLAAQLQATSGWIQAAGLPTAATTTALQTPVVGSVGAPAVSGNRNSHHHHSESRTDTKKEAQKAISAKSSGRAKNTSSSLTHRSSTSHAQSSSTSHGHRTTTEKRARRSRSPIRRSSTSTRDDHKQHSSAEKRSSTSQRKDWSKPSSRYMTLHSSGVEKRDATRNPYSGTSQSQAYNSSGGALEMDSQTYGSSAISYGKQQQYGGTGRISSASYDRHTQQDSSQQGGRQFFPGPVDRYGVSANTDSYASRTDPSYGQRVGQQQYSTSVGSRAEMFGHGTFGDPAVMNYASASQYGRDQDQSSSYYNNQQQSVGWGSSAERLAGTSRAFQSSGTNGGGGGGGWNRQAENILSEWNMYAGGAGHKDGSSGRYQQQQSYGGRSGSSVYPSGGRRY